MSAVALDWSEHPPSDRLVTMPPFPLDGSVRTLGPGVVEWMTENLIQPDGPRAGQPFRPTPDQVDFLLWFYALDDQARWLHNLGVRRLSKGKGKSPFAAALALAEFLGPVRLDRFDDRVPGGCVGRPVEMPLVQIVAAAESQTKNTMRYVRAFCPKGGALAKRYGIDVGKTQFYKLPEGTLEVITSSFTAAEGAQTTFAVGDETEHWLPSNQGHELNATIIDNLTKTGGRMVHTCNAWKPGIESVAEATWDDWVAQEEGRSRADQRILYDARVAPPDTDMRDRDSLMAALEHCYWGSPWVDLENIIQRIWRASAKPDDSQRKYLNRPTADREAWVTPEQVARLARPSVRVNDGDRIALFFDGSKSRDASALVACRIDDGHTFPLGVWEPDGDDDTIDVAAVDAAVIRAFARFDVAAFFADVREFESFVKITWPERYGDRLDVMAVPSGRPSEPIAWDMRGHAYEFAKASEMVLQEIIDGEFTIGPADDSPEAAKAFAAMGRHLANCRIRWYRDAMTVRKESANSPLKIDAAVCLIGARMVRRLVLSQPKKARSGKVYV